MQPPSMWMAESTNCGHSERPPNNEPDSAPATTHVFGLREPNGNHLGSDGSFSKPRSSTKERMANHTSRCCPHEAIGTLMQRMSGSEMKARARLSKIASELDRTSNQDSMRTSLSIMSRVSSEIFNLRQIARARALTHSSMTEPPPPVAAPTCSSIKEAPPMPKTKFSSNDPRMNAGRPLTRSTRRCEGTNTWLALAGRTRPAMSCNNVDFPAPWGPTT
mmetsp:Transcript_62522/g.179808  ORF Transcript_62522/g.179808 Transcript_62522/m.179808 type:complete len:219 (-) Transcript_62522:2098-2754(-)